MVLTNEKKPQLEQKPCCDCVRRTACDTHHTLATVAVTGTLLAMLQEVQMPGEEGQGAHVDSSPAGQRAVLPPSVADASPASQRPIRTWRTKAVRDALQMEIESRLGEQVATPSMAIAKEAQNRLLPHDQDGKLLPLMCPLETFKIFGAGVYAYVSWISFMEKVFFVAFAFSLPNMIHNIAGGELSPEESTWMTVHTLGNVNHVNASYGAVELIVATVFMLALARGTKIIDKATAEVEADGVNQVVTSPGGTQTSNDFMGPAALRTVMVRGLPAAFGKSDADESEALRTFMEQWGGTVQHLVLARRNRALLLRMRSRKQIVEELHVEQVHVFIGMCI